MENEQSNHFHEEETADRYLVRERDGGEGGREEGEGGREGKREWEGGREEGERGRREGGREGTKYVCRIFWWLKADLPVLQGLCKLFRHSCVLERGEKCIDKH